LDIIRATVEQWALRHFAKEILNLHCDAVSIFAPLACGCSVCVRLLSAYTMTEGIRHVIFSGLFGSYVLLAANSWT
jgi:hypothetical protein